MIIMTEEIKNFENPVLTESAKIWLLGLASRLTRHFDLYYNHKIGDSFFDLYAYHKNVFSKSFITKATVYESFNVFEHMLFKYEKDFSREELTQFQDRLKELTLQLVESDKFHKQSTIIGVVVCENTVPVELKKSVKKYIYRKNYKFSFWGWSETTCVVISLADKTVYLSRGNKNLKKLFTFENKKN